MTSLPISKGTREGLSLMGFLGREEALHHMRSACIPAVGSDAALEAEWHAARAVHSEPTPNAGHPHIQWLSSTDSDHMRALVEQKWLKDAIKAGRLPVDPAFAWVEVDPLLAFQITIDRQRCDTYLSRLLMPPSSEALMALCLPLQWPKEEWTFKKTEHSLMVRSSSLNVQISAKGLFEVGDGILAGVKLGTKVPLTQVVTYGGLHFLKNGYHRALAARLAGATHIPCLVTNTRDAATIGILPPDTFSLKSLCGSDPPTLGHLAQGRGYPVRLRTTNRIIHVSWAEYAMHEAF